MEVRQWMKHPVHSVKPLDSLQHARELMANCGVNQLPVVVDRRLAGIITDRDVRDAFPSVFDSPPFERRKRKVAATDPETVTVEMVMTTNVTSVAPNDSLTNAVQLLRKQRIGALPVVEAERLVGILTRSDVLDAYLDLEGTGTGRKFSGDATAASGMPQPVKTRSRATRRRAHSA
jgi:acetoin utilization protein AcuB